MHRNKLELPHDFDAFSSKEIIETYDEEEEKRWRTDHQKKMKDHKRKEADDIFQKLEELELMEELENELEELPEMDVDAMQSMLSGSNSEDKRRISHFETKSDDAGSTFVENYNESVHDDANSGSGDSDTNDDDEDDDDIPVEFKEIEKKAESMTNKAKLNFFKSKLAEVQDYLQNFKPRTIEEVSHKTDKMFLSDHLLSVIETIADELNCDQYLNGDHATNDESDSDAFATVVKPNVSTQTKPILKKSNNKNVSNRKISFALEDDVKSFDGREEPSKISTTVIFEQGPVLHLNINHSEATFKDTNDKSDVIRSPVDIYKKFADLTLTETVKEHRPRVLPNRKLNNSPESQPNLTIDNRSNQTVPQEKKVEALDQDIAAAKTEVKEILDNIFGPKDTNEPDPLPEGNFVDSHQPKKRISLFKQRRQMKSQ